MITPLTIFCQWDGTPLMSRPFAITVMSRQPMTTPHGLPTPPVHGYAADNARRDSIHLIALSCGRLADGNAGGHQEAAQTSQQAGNGERGNADGSGVDAGNAGGLKVAAAGINTPSAKPFWTERMHR